MEGFPKVLAKGGVLSAISFPELFLDLAVLKEGILDGEETMRLGIAVLGVGFGEGAEGQLV